MRRDILHAAFVPLVDAAPLVAAHELGFAAEERLALELRRAPSWSALRDALAYGQVEAAHMLAPVPVAGALGLGGGAASLEALSVLSVNGTVVGVSSDLGARMVDAGHPFDFRDAAASGRALIAAAPEVLRVGVPFPFSMQAELVIYWLGRLGLPPERLSIHTVPPPLMGEAIGAGEIDAFCVGEPWGSMAVETGVGRLLLPGAAIWAFAPEKVLAVRTQWSADAPELAQRLVRALWRAQRWLSEPDARSLTVDLLARPEYLDLPPEIVERALRGRLVIGPNGERSEEMRRLVTFHDGSAAFPWRSQAAWIGTRLAERFGLDRAASARTAAGVFRSDVFRSALAPLGVDLPAASSRVEGGFAEDGMAPSMRGSIEMYRDAFFDGSTFDPAFT